MLNQQQHEFRELLDQDLVNIIGRTPIVNESVVFKQVINRPIPAHATMVQEGNNEESKSYQGPKQPEVQRNDEPKGYYMHTDFMIFNSSSFNGKEDPIGVMDWMSEMELAFLTCGCTGKLESYKPPTLQGSSRV